MTSKEELEQKTASMGMAALNLAVALPLCVVAFLNFVTPLSEQSGYLAMQHNVDVWLNRGLVGLVTIAFLGASVTHANGHTRRWFVQVVALLTLVTAIVTALIVNSMLLKNAPVPLPGP